ncbi:MAG: twin-arginine translocase TatA/TatE family subunit [Deltaproteobacteria bacterium]|jgi:sec-independent protein translocase protein TatA|nr:twin-arginine translocase TatA/TatE family subunit [Deltaproteobacteria bacterium]
MFGNIHLQEILVILLVIVVIFGANRLPELGKGLGRGLRNFRKAMSGKEDLETSDQASSQAESRPADSSDQK